MSGKLAGLWPWRRLPSIVRASGRYWDQQHEHPSGDVRFWLDLPIVRHTVNVRVTGRGDVWPLTAFVDLVSGHAPVERALSLGCGVGHLERDVVKRGAAKHVDGVDVGEGVLRAARETARQEGLQDRITYHLCDAVTWLRRSRAQGYDLVFFNGSLHHMQALEEVLELSAECLRQGKPGWMFVDEYVGPSRGEWTDEDLEPARVLFQRVPDDCRRAPVLWPPIAIEDPTEMIRSSDIEPLLRHTFEVIHCRPYFGNVLFPLVAGIKPPCLELPIIVDIIHEAIKYETELIERRALEPMFAAYAARPRQRTAKDALAR